MQRVASSYQQGCELAEQLSDWQFVSAAPAGLDTETTGCDPSEQSPIGHAKLWCMTLAWGYPTPDTPSPFHSAMVMPEAMPGMLPWLENPDYHKVGSNIHSYDRHVIPELRGIIGDTVRMSRLLNPSKLHKNDLKTWGERLGYEVSTMDQICYRPARNKDKTYKRERSCLSSDGVPTLYIAGTVCCFSTTKREYLDWDTLWRDYPQRRAAIARYAVQDACMSLDVYYHLLDKLGEVAWVRTTD